MMWSAVAAGAVAGIAANVTGYLVTGRLFHPYQKKTPDTWRAGENWAAYTCSALVRIFACIAIAVLYSAVGFAFPSLGADAVVRGATFGAILWLVTILPMQVEASQFVNFHWGFVIGILLDWLVTCALAGIAGAIAVGTG